jgi:hypothetical protein
VWAIQWCVGCPQVPGVSYWGFYPQILTVVWTYDVLPPSQFTHFQHDGFGAPIRCEVSGEYFPSSRIKVDWLGRQVGDIYWTEGPRPPGIAGRR